MPPRTPRWPWWRRPLELRIDVGHDADKIELELDALHRRLNRPGDALHGIAAVPTSRPGLVLRWRAADGDFYVYVEDRVRGCLAGYTVFNRLIELDVRADRWLRAPHSKYRPAYQRQGLASAVYRWGLDAGLCLITGARQSPAANALWHGLARCYPRIHVDLRDRVLTQLAEPVDAARRGELHTRMLLLGRDWSVARLAADAGLRLVA
ncbi:MAG: N-acetyltransferase [Rubrivivax sp.]